MQVGKEGVLVVDTGLANMSDKVAAAIRKLSDGPIRYVVNTHVHADHTGGNEKIAGLGSTIVGGNVTGDIADAGKGAAVIAHQTLLDRMSMKDGNQAAFPSGAWPTDTFTDEKDLYFDGEGIQVIHQPAAHTDGDSFVFFRRSDVVSAGDIFVTTGYPIIDLARGGSLQGIIDALNRLIALTIPAGKQEGGTMVIPGHGRLCDQADVVFYQEMVTILRDRIRVHDQERHDAGAGEGGAGRRAITIRCMARPAASGPRTCSWKRRTRAWAGSDALTAALPFSARNFAGERCEALTPKPAKLVDPRIHFAGAARR